MKNIYPFVFALLILASCSTSKDYLSRIDEDKTFFDAVKSINKHADDSDAVKALPVLYSHTQEKHLRKIGNYNSSTEMTRWDKIISEYNYLQKMYDAVIESPAAGRVVKPTDYRKDITDITQAAADDHYMQADNLIASGNKMDARTAYKYYAKADKLVPGYKNARAKMAEAYQQGTLNVIINEIQDNSYYQNSNWNNYNASYKKIAFQQNLVRELARQNTTRYPAKFYTDEDAMRSNVKPDLVVELLLRNLDVPNPTRSTNSYRRSQEIEVGRDTSGRTIYNTVYAVVNVEQRSYRVSATMELTIFEADTKKRSAFNSYRDSYQWTDQYGSYTGDSRALTSEDLRIVNNYGGSQLNMSEALDYIYERIYPQVKNRIKSAVEF